MKSKLLKKIRSIGRGMININSVTYSDGISVGMSYGYDSKEYSGLFEMGDSEEIVKEKACRVYLESNINCIRNKYKKYSKSYKVNSN